MATLPLRSTFFLLSLVFVLLTNACGEVTTQTNTFPSPGSSGSNPETAAVVHVSDFTATGILTVVESLDDVFQSDININVSPVLPHTDTVLRSFNGLLYVVNRLGRDSIQVVDPFEQFATLIEFSTGAGTNPHDILIVSPTKAYVTLYQPEANGTQELFIVNPTTGALIKYLDLTLFTDNDGERLARAERMTRVGNEVWVLIQDLDGSFGATTNGKIAVISTVTDSYVDVDLNTPGIQAIQLAGRNPSYIEYDSKTNQVFVSMTGVFQPDFLTDTTDPYGGIEVLDPVTYASFGLVIDDDDIGGYPWGVQIHSAQIGFTMADSKRVTLFNPTTFQVIDTNLYESPGTFLPDILLDGEGHLLIAERGDLQGMQTGLIILDITDSFSQQGPLDIGGPPTALAVVEVP